MLTALIMQISCSTVYTSYSEACNKATEAFIKQSGIEHNLSSLESYGKSKAYGVATKYVGDENTKLIGSATYAYSVFKNKSLTFKIPSFGVADNINTTLTSNSGQVGLQWSLR